MEAEIEKFLSGYGNGGGHGNGNGNGNGDGYGHAYGDGSGGGNGYGNGSSNGSGNGNGNGDGYGSNNGSGDGNGNGDGYGGGYGHGYVGGDGCGHGNGDASERRIAIKQFKGSKVYYVDNIPCIFKSIHENYAVIYVIEINSFELKRAFIGKFRNCLAHGETIREAITDAQTKYYQTLDFDEVKEELLTKFKEKGKLTVKELYDWHGILTGSCRFGRTQFQTEHNLKDGDLLTLEEFVELTKDAFCGEKIARLLQKE